MKKTQGNLEPKQQGGTMKSEMNGYSTQLADMVENTPTRPLQNTANIGDKCMDNGLVLVLCAVN
jgi:hypothetical protein